MLLVRQFTWCERCRIAADWTVMDGYTVCNVCGTRRFYARRRLLPVLFGGLVILTGCLVYSFNLWGR